MTADALRGIRPRPAERAAVLAALAGSVLQVLVIGGGVVGAAVALDATTRGLSVGLVRRVRRAGRLPDQVTGFLREGERVTGVHDLAGRGAEC